MALETWSDGTMVFSTKHYSEDMVPCDCVGEERAYYFVSTDIDTVYECMECGATWIRTDDPILSENAIQVYETVK